MRWSIIRLICFRELRDQLRDRRTLFMIAILPILLYPVGGVGLMKLALASGLSGQKSTVLIVGHEHLPPWSPRFHPAVAAAAWFAATPAGPGCPLVGVERLTAAAALSAATQLEMPPLYYRNGDRLRFLPPLLTASADRDLLTIELSTAPAPADLDKVDRSLLQARKVDCILVVPPDFAESFEQGERAHFHFLVRDGDERSRVVYNRLSAVLSQWKARLKDTRLLRQKLPADFDEPFDLSDSEKSKTDQRKVSDELGKIFAQIFPFVIVMWSLAGGLYPAVDLCAGEKERGTMETLLISPASREEIVWGKFLTIWIFSAATALFNLVSMGVTTWVFASSLNGLVPFRITVFFWGAVLLLPLSAFFSALCLAVGVYARSSKEGQYYLMPLFLLTMPLVFITLVPGVELNHFYCMVPVTGVALLLQSLIRTGSATGTQWMYLLPVLAPMVIYSWLALRWAIEQFQREEVLFREAERLEIRLWLKRLFREKEQLPSTGQALFCFVAVLVLHWVASAMYALQPERWALMFVDQIVVVAVPLFMALLLTRRPDLGLAIRPAPAWSWPVAVVLAALLFLPGVESAHYFLSQFPAIRESLKASQPLLRDAVGTAQNGLGSAGLVHALGAALLAAVCEELTFRGFILTGLRRRLRPWTAVVVSSFLFAAFQMNVFQCVPHFALGVVLGLLVWRSGSVLPAIVFHFVYNALIYGLLLTSGSFDLLVDSSGQLTSLALTLSGISALLGAALLAVVVAWSKKPEMHRPLPDGDGFEPAKDRLIMPMPEESKA